MCGKPKHSYVVYIEGRTDDTRRYQAGCACGWHSPQLHLDPDGYVTALDDFAAHIMPFVKDEA